jgi:hypothetical protein
MGVHLFFKCKDVRKVWQEAGLDDIMRARLTVPMEINLKVLMLLYSWSHDVLSS